MWESQVSGNRDAGPGQPRLNVGVRDDIIRVVIGHEVEVKDLTIYDEDRGGKEEIDPEVAAEAGRGRHR
jgi:hypothetical protein